MRLFTIRLLSIFSVWNLLALPPFMKNPPNPNELRKVSSSIIDYSKLIYIPQGYLGFLNFESPIILATSGLAPCVGLAMWNQKEKWAALAHFDSDAETTSGEIIKKILAWIRHNHSAGPEQVIIIPGSSSNLNPGIITNLERGLNEEGIKFKTKSISRGGGTDFFFSSKEWELFKYDFNRDSSHDVADYLNKSSLHRSSKRLLLEKSTWRSKLGHPPNLELFYLGDDEMKFQETPSRP